MLTKLTLPIAASIIMAGSSIALAQGTVSTGADGTMPRVNRGPVPGSVAAPDTTGSVTTTQPADRPGVPDVVPPAANPLTGPGSGVQGGGAGGGAGGGGAGGGAGSN